jgi:hypothetical protein
MIVVIPQMLCEALRPLRRVPLSATGRGRRHSERSLDELLEFPTV